MGGDDRRASPARDRLARQRLDARVREPGRAPERALHDAGRPVPLASPRNGRTPTACRSTPSCSAAGGRPWCRWSPRRSTGSTASSSARRCRWRRPRRPRARSASSASTRWRCCRSAATTWPTTSATGCGSDAAAGSELPRVYPRQLVPQGRRRQLHLARLRREQPRARVDLPPLRRRGRGGRDPDRAGSGARRDQHRGPRAVGRGPGAAARGGRGRSAPAAAAGRGAPGPLRRPPPGGAQRAARSAQAPARRTEALSSSSPGARRPRPAPGPCAPASRPG